MTDERWQEIVSGLSAKFSVLSHGHEDAEPGQREYFEFQSDDGRIRLERTVRPKLVDRRMITSARIGAEGREEAIYSDEETVSFIQAFKWSDEEGDWVEIQL